MEEYINTRTEEDELDYLAELLVSIYLESKGYKSYPWLNGETKWRKENNDTGENSDNGL